MWEYLKYLSLILIGVCIGNVWSYIKRLELANQLLTSDVFHQLQKQKEQSYDSD